MQDRHPATITAVDAPNCYDRVNHNISWPALLGFVGFPPIYVALCCLQHMKCYQRTGFGDSKTFFGGLKAFFKDWDKKTVARRFDLGDDVN